MGGMLCPDKACSLITDRLYIKHHPMPISAEAGLSSTHTHTHTQPHTHTHTHTSRVLFVPVNLAAVDRERDEA